MLRGYIVLEESNIENFFGLQIRIFADGKGNTVEDIDFETEPDNHIQA